MKKNHLTVIFEDVARAEKAGTAPRTIYAEMADEDRERLFKALAVSAAMRTGARIDAPAKMYMLVRENLDDVSQSAHLRFLEAIERDAIFTRDGEQLNFIRLVARACNGAVTHAWREIYSHPTAAASMTDENGKEYSLIDIYAGAEIKRPAAPGAALMARETIAEVLQFVPAVWRSDALQLLKLHEAGYTYTTIARSFDCSMTRIAKIKAAIAAAAAAYAEELPASRSN